MSQQYYGVLSTAFKIKTNLPTEADDDEEDDDEYNYLKEKQWINKQIELNQMKMRHDHFQGSFIYVESVRDETDVLAFQQGDKDRGRYFRIKIINSNT
jgi:hypothetical protein